MKNFFYKKYLFIFSSVIMAALAVMIATNYYADPTFQFSRQANFEKKLVATLKNTEQTFAPFNYNERSVQKQLMAQFNIHPDILILGSSRSMAINQHTFKQPIYNASVTYGSLQDEMAFYYLFQKKWGAPKTVIICLDPWLLDKNNEREHWKLALADEYAAATRLYGSAEKMSWLDKANQHISSHMMLLSQLLNIGNFKTSINSLLTSRKTTHELCPDYPECTPLFNNGTRMQSNTQENTLAATADERAIDGVRTAVNLYLNFPALDANYKNHFEHFINYLTAQNIQVIFYLPPFEPKAYAENKKSPVFDMINVSEQYYIDFATSHHVEIIGSYNPDKLHLAAGDFIDGTHLKTEGIDRVFA